MKDEKRIVKNFYENYGWQRTEDGIYKDTAAFVDTRPVMRNYQQHAMTRLAKCFHKSGNLFLDVGSGALGYDEYTNVGADFQQRICADISLNALRQAKENYDGDLWCVVADISALPFRDNVFDGVLCAHVLYHLPAADQAPAIHELHRLVASEGCCVIVYTWTTSMMDKIALSLNPRKIFPKIPGMRLVWRTFFKSAMKNTMEVPCQPATSPPLFFCPQDYSWYRKEIAPNLPVSLACWQAVSLPFSQAFILDKHLSRILLGTISFLEKAFPAFMGKIGAYPLFILHK